MYVDCYHDKSKDRVHVVERDEHGSRVFKDFAANYVFYYDDPVGKHRSIYGNPVTRVHSRTNKNFRRELKLCHGKKIYESDIKPVFRILEDNYLGAPSPKLNVCFFDIEVDFDKTRGFATPDDPFNMITSISLYLQWQKKLITLCIAPPTIDKTEAEKITSKFENCFLFDSEKELIDIFLTLIDDADVLSGWNSEGSFK